MRYYLITILLTLTLVSCKSADRTLEEIGTGIATENKTVTKIASPPPLPTETITPSTTPANRETAITRIKGTRTALAQENPFWQDAIKTVWQENRNLTKTILALTPSLTSSNTNTPTSTKTPTTTSTPVATLISHQWVPENILIRYDYSGGDGGCAFKRISPPNYTLYANGSLIIYEYNDITENHELKMSQLNNHEVCYLLNSIDQAGFFDYDSSDYNPFPENYSPLALGLSDIEIQVQAWRSHKVSLYGLGFFLSEKEKFSDDPRFPIILPAIENTYNLLINYRPKISESYLTNRLGVWIDTYVYSNEISIWPFENPRLTDIAAQKSSDGVSDYPDIILTGEKANKLYKEFTFSIEQCGLHFSEGNNVFVVYVRPLLPDEFSENIIEYTDMLSCDPSDGYYHFP